eukprot:9973072-Alexandrium_andersonii.AAC.1
MSASLVGSEMCIRDRSRPACGCLWRSAGPRRRGCRNPACGRSWRSVWRGPGPSRPVRGRCFPVCGRRLRGRCLRSARRGPGPSPRCALPTSCELVASIFQEVAARLAVDNPG